MSGLGQMRHTLHADISPNSSSAPSTLVRPNDGGDMAALPDSTSYDAHETDSPSGMYLLMRF
jgi:hypothetical protein